MNTEKKVKKKRTMFTKEQVVIMKKYFTKSDHIGHETLKKLTKLLDLTEDNIRVWFKNRRSKNKRSKSLSPNNVSEMNPHGAVLTNLSLQESYQYVPKIETAAPQNFSQSKGSYIEFLNNSDDIYSLDNLMQPNQLNMMANFNNYPPNSHNNYSFNNKSYYAIPSLPVYNPRNHCPYQNYQMGKNEDRLTQYPYYQFLSSGPGYTAGAHNLQGSMGVYGLYRQETTRNHPRMAGVTNSTNNVTTTPSYLQENGSYNVQNNVHNYPQPGTNDMFVTYAMDDVCNATNNMNRLKIVESRLATAGTQPEESNEFFYLSSSPSRPQINGRIEMFDFTPSQTGDANGSNNVQILLQSNRLNGSSNQKSPESRLDVINGVRYNNEPI